LNHLSPKYLSREFLLHHYVQLTSEGTAETLKIQIRGSSVSIATGYQLDDWGFEVQFPEGAGYFYLLYHMQTSSGVHPAS
jgi:hypothetical protein